MDCWNEERLAFFVIMPFYHGDGLSVFKTFVTYYGIILFSVATKYPSWRGLTIGAVLKAKVMMR